MRIAVDHRTLYRFTEPQARIIQMLRMRPCDTRTQTVVDWRIDVDCDARLRRSEDGFGNEVTMLYAEGPLDSIELRVTGEVLTLESNGVVADAPEPLPPMLFLRETPRTAPGEMLTKFATEAVSGIEDPLERLHRLNTALHARFKVAPVAPDHGETVADSFLKKQLTARDRAQIFVAAARCCGAPARYVSGYRQTEEASLAPDAWAEAHVPDLGWVAFDPESGACADESYIRVAVALDATGAAPISGQRVGAGEEALDVDVQVEQLGVEG
ncbi:transglutaminase family protein [Stakelama tenebrarum]|uniref:Transglutaminase family protein n=1 Tax=Stakelama tenebrarum TaxID=2711215 RepID=A0A6G6Y8X8_9SPHN|nr:transglutaminase family protein [Sphingosinithalassobacter tenebrarum]QIG81301.1 transglutaminase family protein [Sphingosinithalassobacter tenebrarum]